MGGSFLFPRKGAGELFIHSIDDLSEAFQEPSAKHEFKDAEPILRDLLRWASRARDVLAEIQDKAAGAEDSHAELSHSTPRLKAGGLSEPVRF